MATQNQRAETPSDDGNSDVTDIISLADTVHSDCGDNQVWELENIVAEAECEDVGDDGEVGSVTQYLLKWKGYSVYRSTWETAEHLVDGVPETWRAWQESKMRVARGFARPFDIEAWEDKCVMRYGKRIRRHQRRNRKRERLGLPTVNYAEDREDSTEIADTSSNVDDHAIGNSADQSSDEEPLVKRVRKPKMHNRSDDDVERASPTKRRRRTAELIEREREYTRALLKRKKGIAMPKNKNEAIGTGTFSSKPTTSSKTSLKPTTLVAKSPTSTARLAHGVGNSSSGTINAAPSSSVQPKKSNRSHPAQTIAPDLLGSGSIPLPHPHVMQPAPTSSSSAQLQPAPIARMVGGPSRIYKKPVPMIGRTPVRTTNIFVSVDKAVQRRSRDPNTGLYKSVSHRYKAQRAAQQEAIPALDDLVLRDPATARPISQKPQLSHLNFEAAVSHRPKLMRQSSGDTPATGSTDGEEEAFRFLRFSVNPPMMKDSSPIAQSNGHAQLSNTGVAQPGNYSKPCHFFAMKGLCRWGSGCPFPHVDPDGPIMSRREMNAQITCRFWYSGTCNKSEETCLYSHSEKAFLSPATSKDPPTRLELGISNTLAAHQKLADTDHGLPRELPPTSADSSSGPLLQGEQMSCNFWFFTECKNTAQSCKFAHHLCRYVAGRPPHLQPILTASVLPLAQTSSSAHTATDVRGMINPTTTSAYSTTASKSLTHSTALNSLSHATVLPTPASLPGSLVEASMPLSSRSNRLFHLERQVSAVITPANASDSSSGALLSTLDELKMADIASKPDLSTLPMLETDKQNKHYSVSCRSPSCNHKPINDTSKATTNIGTGKLTATAFFYSANKTEPELDCNVVLMGKIPASMIEMPRIPTAISCKLDFHHICTAESLFTFVDPNSPLLLGHGDVMAADGSDDQLSLLTDHLKIHSAGALCCLSEFNIVFFPVKQSHWKSFQPQVVHPEARLHFCIVSLATPSPWIDTVLSSQLKDPASRIWKAATGLDIDRMFGWNSGEIIDKVVFLMFPPQNQDDTQYINTYLRAASVKVYRSSVPGSWYRFSYERRSGGAVLFHPDFHAYGQIPSLVSKMLKVGRFNFFQIRLVNSKEYSVHLEGRLPDTTFTLTRLFPHGRAVLISDACFSGNPGDTLDVVKAILHRIKTTNPNSTKLLGRPGLLPWLYDLAISARNHERDSLFSFEDTKNIELYTLLAQIVQADTNYVERLPTASRPTDFSPVYFPPESDMPGYDDLAKGNPQAADNLLAAWFAGWAHSRIEEFRRFLIVQPGDMVKQWSEKYKHIEVLTPHQYLQEARLQEGTRVNNSKKK